MTHETKKMNISETKISSEGEGQTNIFKKRRLNEEDNTNENIFDKYNINEKDRKNEKENDEQKNEERKNEKGKNEKGKNIKSNKFLNIFNNLFKWIIKEDIKIPSKEVIIDSIDEIEFRNFHDVISKSFNPKVVFVTDESKGEAENMFREDNNENSWITRRRRDVGHEWMIVKLKYPCIIYGIEINFEHLNNDICPHLSIEAVDNSTIDKAIKEEEAEQNKIINININEETSKKKKKKSYNFLESLKIDKSISNLLETENTPWMELLQADCVDFLKNIYKKQNYFFKINNLDLLKPWTHIRINLYPDGGIHRIHFYGEFINPILFKKMKTISTNTNTNTTTTISTANKNINTNINTNTNTNTNISNNTSISTNIINPNICPSFSSLSNIFLNKPENGCTLIYFHCNSIYKGHPKYLIDIHKMEGFCTDRLENRPPIILRALMHNSNDNNNKNNNHNNPNINNNISIFKFGCRCIIENITIDISNHKFESPEVVQIQLLDCLDIMSLDLFEQNKIFYEDEKIGKKKIDWFKLPPCKLTTDEQKYFFSFNLLEYDFSIMERTATHFKVSLHPDGGVTQINIKGIPI